MARAEEFLTAATEHLAALKDLPEIPRHFPLAYYLAGLALECLFRAYAELVGAPHDARHDLTQLADNSLFFSFMPETRRSELQDYLFDVYKRWLNNHRYRSVASLRRFLTAAELYKNGHRVIKGDIVRYNWNILSESAIGLLTTGIDEWTNSRRKFRG